MIKAMKTALVDGAKRLVPLMIKESSATYAP
jgi:hypothetical protein